MHTSFENRVVIVTGAGSGIGRAMAVAFAREGARVVVADLDTDGAEKTAASIGAAALAVRVDIADADSVEQLVARGVAAFDRIDVLCNNAGIIDTMALPAEMSVAEWDRVIRVNLTGTFLVTRAVLPHMLERGRGAIVNTASEAGIRGGASGVAYTASKHGVVGVTRNVAWSYADKGIRCNAILPGPTLTGLAEAVSKLDPVGVQRYQPIIAIPQALALPEQMAEVAVFLASDAASFVNGAIVPVDAAWSAA
ncbi:SDR family NAD(P)-dependent oxidoreductase [Nocardia jejuensis]|uniref:SDR family NAD(P)-dependent oxidoreductase n=1 Tax=Nocardia jejuensis TaxID=328049 RepID=UPI0008358656|nr:SDR family oxidoreductase [Nocardia jejuensis]